MKKRAIRRCQEIRKKHKVEKIMKESWGYPKELLNERSIGKNTKTHARPCSCSMCGNPRKYRHEKTRQEIIADISEKDID